MVKKYTAHEYPTHFELFYEGNKKPLKVSKHGLSPEKADEIRIHMDGTVKSDMPHLKASGLKIKPIKLAHGGVGVKDSGYQGDPLQAVTGESFAEENSPTFDQEAASPMMKQQYGETDNEDGNEKPQMVLMAADGVMLRDDLKIKTNSKDPAVVAKAPKYNRYPNDSSDPNRPPTPYFEIVKAALHLPNKAKELVDKQVAYDEFKVDRQNIAVDTERRNLEEEYEDILREAIESGKRTDEQAKPSPVQTKETKKGKKEKKEDNFDFEKENAKYKKNLSNLKRQIVGPEKFYPTEAVIPMIKANPKKYEQLADGGHLKKGDADTYITKDGEETRRGLWANVYMKKKREGKLADGGEVEGDEYHVDMADGGYVVTRSSDRKGKTHKVTRKSDGKVEYFGDSELGQHPKDKDRREAFYARHAKNIAGNPFFAAFAHATWKADGGEVSGLEATRRGENKILALAKNMREHMKSARLYADGDFANEEGGEAPSDDEESLDVPAGTEGEDASETMEENLANEADQAEREANSQELEKFDVGEFDPDKAAFEKEQQEFLQDKNRVRPEMEAKIHPFVYKFGAQLAGAKNMDEYRDTLKQVQPIFSKASPEEKAKFAEFMKETSERLQSPSEPVGEKLAKEIEEGIQSEEEAPTDKKEEKKKESSKGPSLSLKSKQGPAPLEPVQAAPSGKYKEYYDGAIGAGATPEQATTIAKAMDLVRGGDTQQGYARQETAPATGMQTPKAAAPEAPAEAPKVSTAPSAAPVTQIAPAPAAAPVTGTGANVAPQAAVSPAQVPAMGGAAPVSTVPPAAMAGQVGVLANLVRQLNPQLPEDQIQALAQQEFARQTATGTGGLTPQQIEAARQSPEYQQVQEATRQAIAATNEQAKLKIAADNIKATVGQKELDLRMKQQQEYEVRSRLNMLQRQDLRTAILNAKIDPKNYWDNHSKVATGIGLILGVIGKSMGGKGSVADFVQEQIDHDLDRQYKDIDKKKSVLGDLVKEGNDLEDSFKLADAFYKDMAAAQIEQQMGGIKDQQTIVSAQQAVAKLQMDAAKAQDDVLKKQLEMQYGPARSRVQQAGKNAITLLDMLRMERDLQKQAEMDRRAGQRLGQGQQRINLAQDAGKRAQVKADRDALAKTGTPEQISFFGGQPLGTGQFAKLDMKSKPYAVPQLDPNYKRTGNVVSALSPPDAKDIKSIDNDADTFINDLNELEEIAKTYEYTGFTAIPGITSGERQSDMAKAQKLQDDLKHKMAGKSQYNLGVVQESEYKRLSDVIPDVTTWRAEGAGLKAKFGQFRNDIRQAQTSMRNNKLLSGETPAQVEIPGIIYDQP
jgi:hypothetical protein